MTHTRLIQTLAREIKKALEGVKMATEPGATVNVNVFENYLPKNLFEETNYFPCVMVEWLGTTDDLKTGTTATIGLSIGVYAPEADGWKDAFHIMEIVREKLLTERLMGERYWLEREMNWQPAQSQPSPFFFITATADYGMRIVT